MDESREDARSILVVANEAVEGGELTDALLDHLAGQTVRVCLITPILVESALDHEMGDVDRSVGPAKERLERSLAALHEVGIEAVGEIADADPMVAISDELQKFHADEIVLVDHQQSDRAWAERNLRSRAHHEFEQPITELVVTRPTDADIEDQGSPGHESPHLVGVEHEDAGATKHEADLEPSQNFPPLRARDIAAITVGIVGSIVLVTLAAYCAIGEEGPITGACAVKVMIALTSLLINGAHIVALIFFQSLRYEGLMEKFFAAVTIAGTTLAVVVSAAI